MKLFCNNAYYHLEIHQNKRLLPYLLFFHGFMGSSKSFEPLASRLMHSCNPVTIDLLGHGSTLAENDPERFTASKQADDILSLLNRLQLPNLFLYGYSMGGRLAQHVAVRDSFRFSGLILESTHCGITDRADREKRAETDRERAKKIEENFEKFLEHWTALPLFESPRGATDFNYIPILSSQKPELMAASLVGFGAGAMPPVCDRLKTFKVPLGLIAGAADQKYVDKMGEMAQLCHGATFEIIDNAGHRVHADQPEATAKFITQFLENHG